MVADTVEDCYKTLGIIHKLWKPLPGQIKDYISQPKLNGYQSLHTTIFGDKGKDHGSSDTNRKKWIKKQNMELHAHRLFKEEV